MHACAICQKGGATINLGHRENGGALPLWLEPRGMRTASLRGDGAPLPAGSVSSRPVFSPGGTWWAPPAGGRPYSAASPRR